MTACLDDSSLLRLYQVALEEIGIRRVREHYAQRTTCIDRLPKLLSVHASFLEKLKQWRSDDLPTLTKALRRQFKIVSCAHRRSTLSNIAVSQGA